MPAESCDLDREEIKRQVFALEKEYDKITFGLNIVGDHVGRMMTNIKDLKSYIYATEK